jgi:hypothetical protein
MITHRKKIKTKYQIWFPINLIFKDEIKKNHFKKRKKKLLESTRVNLPNPRPGS